MQVVEILHRAGFSQIEGHCHEVPQQVEDLRMLTSGPNLRVLEIGFNAGHSADVFLQNPTTTVVSFDVDQHGYVTVAKKYFDELHPDGRHTLILGDSRVTVPAYTQDHPGVTFDILFIDGGHEYDIALTDLENCAKLAHADTIVVVDDVVGPALATSWTPGPTAAWAKFVSEGRVVELGKKEYGHGRGMVWGKYRKSVT